LKIGNYVHHKDNWSYRQPKQDFNEFDFTWSESDWYALGECTLSLDDIEPIPLTEEWLLRLGFNGWDKGNFTMVLSNGNFIEFGYVIAKNIKHVHQLQNLYFALTNEELTIQN
jgi:hypothetical protein